MEVSKVVKCSRAYPHRNFDEWLLVDDMSIYVKFLQNSADCLCVDTEKKYICRYIFPEGMDELGKIYNFFKYGTNEKTLTRSAPWSPQR